MSTTLFIIIILFVIFGVIASITGQSTQRIERLKRQRKLSAERRSQQSNSPAKTTGRLRELEKLRDEGLLTQAEYKKKRTELVDKL